LDPRLSISNNLAEQSIRPFTIGRKNSLFSDTPKGALSCPPKAVPDIKLEKEGVN